MKIDNILKLILFLVLSLNIFAKPADNITHKITIKDTLTTLIFKGDIQKIDSLINNGLDVNKNLNDKNLKPLLVAIISNKIEIVELLLKNGAKVNDSHQSGMTALMYAIKLKDAKIVQLLVSYNADVNQVIEDTRITPLIYAVKLGAPKIINNLLENNADIFATDMYGYTAHHYALHYHGGDILNIILKARKNVKNIQ